jgi:hypothetical protein
MNRGRENPGPQGPDRPTGPRGSITRTSPAEGPPDGRLAAARGDRPRLKEERRPRWCPPVHVGIFTHLDPPPVGPHPRDGNLINPHPS